MSIWTMLLGEGEARKKVQPSLPPALERLEPRLLLDASLTDPESLLSLDTVSVLPAIVVDLDHEGDGVLTSVSTVLPFSDNSAHIGLSETLEPILSITLPAGDPEITSARPDNAVSPGDSESYAQTQFEIPVLAADAQSDSHNGSAGPAADLNIEITAQTRVAVEGSACGYPANGDKDVPARPSGTDRPVVRQESSQTLPRGPPVAIASSVNGLPNDNGNLEPESFKLTAAAEAPSKMGGWAPELPGLQLTDPNTSNWQGQIIYLDLDGEQNVAYHGPVTVGPFDIPAFQALDELAGQEQAIVKGILAQLDEVFAGCGVIFTTERPQGAQSYSTIYIGGNDSAFAEYGRFLGLAEQVDAGNADNEDKGFVFADPIVRACRSVDMCSSAMARVIAHEAGHLIGFSHPGSTADREGRFSNVALPVELSLGTPVTGTLESSGDSDMYSIQMGAGQHLAVQLDGDNPSDQNELYIRYGALPTVMEYDAAGKMPYRTDQYAEISNTQEGTYYILVRCAFDASWSDSYTVEAKLPEIDSVEIGRQFDYALPGITADDSYGYQVEVKGTGLTGIEFTTPWGYYVDAQDLLPPDRTIQEPTETQRGPLDFTSGIDDHGLPFFLFEWNITAAQWTSLNTGQTAIAVAWDSGAWSASLDVGSVPQSVQEPSPTSPLNRSMEPDNLTMQWGPWDSPPLNSYISIDMNNAWGGGDFSEELPASATSWTPATALGLGAFYRCSLGFNTYAEAVVGGVPVFTQSSAESDLAFVVGIPDTSLQINPDTGHTYFPTPPAQWWRAQAIADGFGGDLATVNDAAEETWIEEQLPPNEMFWIGFTDSRQEGTWEWVSGEPVTYTDWGQWGEPSGGEAEDAAVIYSYAWHDAPVDWWERGIIELPAGAEARLADDHGNTFDEATVVAVPSSLEGDLSYIGDVDLFSFDAVAGKTYEIRVDLPESGLTDSTVWLYDTDGRTVLAWDDDGGHGLGSQLIWTALSSGRYYFAVDSNVLLDFGAYTLQIAERDLVSDTPLAWFDSPALWLELQGNWGAAVSVPYSTGAMSNEAEMLHLLSIDDPSSPVELGQYVPGEIVGGTILADGVRRFYLLDKGPRDSLDHAELVVLDMEVAGAPVEINRIPIASSDASSIAIDGGYLYLGTEIEGIDDRAYLEVYDISNPNAPLFVGLQEIAGPPDSTFDSAQLLVAEGRAYMLHRQAGILSILDVRNPAAPELLGQYTLSTDPSAQAEYMAVAGSVLWVAVGWELHAIDVSDAANPVQRSVLPLDARSHQIVIDGGWAYVATAGMGVKVVDIFDPADPVVVDSYVVAGTFGTLAVNGGYLYLPTSARRMAIFAVPPAPALPDLLVTHISMPVAVGSGEVLPVEWIVQNRSTTPTTAAAWTDAIFLSADQVASPDELVATLEHTGGLAGRGTYNASLDVSTAGITDGTYYVIVATDYGNGVAEQREGNNTTASQRPLSLGITRLTPAVPMPGTFRTTGDAHYYVVSVGAGEHLQIVLDDVNDIGHNELYVRYGQLPTRSKYDVRYSTNLAADQTTEIPDTQAGDYYVLVYAEFAPDVPADFGITVSILDFCILGVSPSSGGQGGEVTIQIKGAGFGIDDTVQLVGADGQTVEAERTVLLTKAEIWATFDLTDSPLGPYDIRIAKATGSSSVQEDSFTVVQGGGADISVDIVGPSVVRAGQHGALQVTVSNKGKNDSLCPIVWIVVPPGWLAGPSEGSVADTREFQLDLPLASDPCGIIPPGDSVTVEVYFVAPMSPGPGTFAAQLYMVSLGYCVSHPSSGGLVGDMEAVATIQSQIKEPTKWNIGTLEFRITGEPVDLITGPSQECKNALTAYGNSTGWSAVEDRTPLDGQVTFTLLGQDQHTAGVGWAGAETIIVRPARATKWVQIWQPSLESWSAEYPSWSRSWIDFSEPTPSTHDWHGDIGGIDDNYPFYYLHNWNSDTFKDRPGIKYGGMQDFVGNPKEQNTAKYKAIFEVYPATWGDDPADKRVFLGEGVRWGYTITAKHVPLTDTHTITVVLPVDPNDKVGPGSFGAEDHIAPDTTMPFTVYYENDPAAGATAPAQEVKIEDTLEEDLNLATFELGDINLYGDYWIDVPDGLQYYETTVDLRPEGNDLLVHVTAGLDSGSRTVTWLFTSLDPDTLALPDDPMTGFLPVNDKAIHNGEGHVTYMIRPMSGLSTGTQITNQAAITFDVNNPIATPTTLNTIDAGLPWSNVLPLPPTVTSTDFLVEWTGQDDPGGAGIASYTIYVSDNGGSWEVWQANTADTSAAFAGTGGHTYAFRSVATDGVGHVEDDPGVAEATTTIIGVGNWDIDDNGSYDALTDGLLTIRYLFGFRGDTLIAEAVAPDANRSTAADIEGYLTTASAAGMLDIDGNGTDDALTDGLLIMRYLFGFRGDTLIDSAVASNATRITAEQIETFIASFMPPLGFAMYASVEPEVVRTSIETDVSSRGRIDAMFDADKNHQMTPRNTEGTPVRRPLLETLEPRLLLSGDGLLGLAAADPNQDLLPDGSPQIVMSAQLPAGSEGILGQPDVLAVIGPAQVIVPDPVTQSVLPGDAFSTTVTYSTADPADETLTGLGLRLHYNSSLLRWDSFSNVYATGKIGQDSSPQNDTADSDGDPSTDMYLTIAWVDLMGNWPGEGLTPLALYEANFTALLAFTGGSTTINFSASSTAVGRTLDATSVTVMVESLPPTVDLVNAVPSLPENTDTTSRVKVADIVVADDGLGTNELSLSGAHAAMFEVDPGAVVGAGVASLYLKAGMALDYETNPVLDVTVAVDDASIGSTPDDTASLSISVTNVNEAPTVALENTITSLPEDTDTSSRVKVADIVVTDDVLGTNKLSLSGADAAMFEVEPTAVAGSGSAVLYLKAGTALDYETNPILDVTVAVDDLAVGGTPDDTASLSISITDVNEAPTVSLANTVTTRAENTDTTSRVKVADIVVTDDALGTNELSLSGADAALFEIVGTGLYLKAGTVLDYETKAALNVAVAVDDLAVGGTPDDTASLSISVTDVNEAPTVALANTTTSLAENTDTTSRVKVADVVVTDDALGTNALSVSGADAALFEVEPTAVAGSGSAVLYLKAGAVLNYQTNPVLDVTVAVDDPTVGTTPDDTASLSISVTDVGALTIDSYRVRRGRVPGDDAIKMSGRFDVPTSEIVVGEQIQVRILASGGSELFHETITIRAADLRRGVYTYRASKGSLGGVALLKLDTKRHTFELSVAGIDLSGLSYPLTLELAVGDYLGSGQTN